MSFRWFAQRLPTQQTRYKSTPKTQKEQNHLINNAKHEDAQNKDIMIHTRMSKNDHHHGNNQSQKQKFHKLSVSAIFRETRKLINGMNN